MMAIALLTLLVDLPQPSGSGHLAFRLVGGFLVLAMIQRYAFPWKQNVIPDKTLVGTNVSSKLSNWNPALGSVIAISRPDCPVCSELKADLHRTSTPILVFEPCRGQAITPCYDPTLDVQTVPTILTLDANGRVVEQLKGYNRDISGLKDRATRANAQGKSNEKHKANS